MRCHVKSASPGDAWVVVPHVGCAHQHSRFVLSVFADKEVTLEGELQAWTSASSPSSWSNLACAQRAVHDASWRNCPQFQLINMGTTAAPVRALLSYGERDAALNKRHTQAVDAGGSSLSASSSTSGRPEEKPMLSMYVMKSHVPDKRFIGTLSPSVDNYVCHSLVTNSWCVQSAWNLEPGDVYSVLCVMGEPTTHEVPMRLTLFTDPGVDEGAVLLNPMTPANEWKLTALAGVTDLRG